MQLDFKNIVLDPIQSRLMKLYLKNNNFERVTIVPLEQGYSVETTFKMIGKKQECRMILNSDFEVVSYECDCNHQGMCAHAGAALYVLGQIDVPSLPYSYVNPYHSLVEEEHKKRYQERRREYLKQRSQKSLQMIDSSRVLYQSRVSALLLDEKYELEPKVSFDAYHGLQLGFKVGLKKKYVVKNIQEFLNWIQENAYNKYGKELAFIHNMESFDEFAQKQIQLMKEAQNVLNQQRNTYYYGTPTLGRTITIDSQMMDCFFDCYQDYELDHLQLVELYAPIPVLIQEEEDAYLLELPKDVDLYFGNNYVYDWVLEPEMVIKRYVMDSQGNGCRFLANLVDEPLVIMKEDYPEFYKYVLSPLGEYLDLQGNVEIKENEYQLIRVYGDLNEHSEIFFKVYFIDEKLNRVAGFNHAITTNYKEDLVEQYIMKYASTIDYEDHIAYFDWDDEKTNEFLHDGIEGLNEYAEVYISDALKKIGQDAHYNITIGVKVEHDLLALDIQSADIPKAELSKVLEQYKRKKKFYRLKNGDLLYLNSPQLDELNSFMEQYHVDPKELKDGRVHLNKNRMFAIDADMSENEYLEFERTESFKRLLDSFTQKDEKEYPVPSAYQNILRDYQKEGYAWLRTLYDYGFNGILADDMGLGKTLQVIALLEGIASDKSSIVVCPSSLIYNWEDEIHKFASHLNVVCIVGTQQNRQALIQQHSSNSLLVTSYDYMRRDYELYETIEFEYVILDEAQYIKNQKTKNAYAVKKLQGAHKLALTGTPIENSLAELWSIMDFLMPQYLFNYHYFQTHYEKDIVKNNDEKKIGQLRKLVSPFILRRNKKDVLLELPDKIEKVQVIPFEEEESQLYYANLAQVNHELQEVFKMDQVDHIAILAMLTRLRQICCEPRLIYENIENSSSKMKACLELIENFKVNNQKVLLFSSFTSVLDLMVDELQLMGIKYYILTGKTSKEERRKLVEGFQNGEVDVFLISLKAGGTGLNLTAAEAVIHYDPWWNVSAQNQATDRAYRIGQNRNVQVFKLVMKDSIEEKIVTLQEKKKELADMFVENNEGGISKMSKEEIMELFR